jgi:DNA-binding NarL/FixJ family response regulator
LRRFLRSNVDRKGETVPRARILLADDYKGMRDRAVRLLESEFEVVGAVEDGRALLEAASKMKPDVCVIDISMPVISGIEAAAQLRESGSTAKIIFLTVHDDPDFVQAALETGASGYVVKSRMASDLHSAVKGVMAGRLFISPSCASGAQTEPRKGTS